MTSASKRRQTFQAVPVIDRISEAVRKGDEEEFGQLISLFRNNETSNTLNQLDSAGSHPLHQAVMYRRLKMLKTMLHYKNSLNLDVCITDQYGQSALDIAMKNRNSQAIEKLVKHGGNATATFEEVYLQLRPDEYPSSPEDSEALLANASCRSEVTLHGLAVCRDHPNFGERQNHLLHPISGTHWRNETCEKAVQECYHDLSKYMDAILIVPLLVASGHLPAHYVEKILSGQSQRERALQLLALLPRCGKHAYQGLFKALKEEETELPAHQELLEQLERRCEVIERTVMLNHAHGDIEESLEKVTTIYRGDRPETPSTHHQGLERSLEWSGRTTESGIYSATPSGGMPATHSSSGRLSTPSRRSTYGSTSHSQSKRRKFSTVQEKPSVLTEDKINHEASSNFREIDKQSPRSSLKVLNAVVKPRDRAAHVQPTSPPLPPNSSSDGWLVTGGARPLPTQATPYTCAFTRSQLQPTSTLDESLENPMFVSSGKSERDDVERDTTAHVLRHSSPATSPPIDIPSRNESYTTLPSPPPTRSPQKFLLRQISRDTSSDSSSSDIIRLDVPSQPKDLSHIPPVRRSLSGTFFGLLKSFKAKLSTVPDSSETTQRRTSSQCGTVSQRGNCYSYGCGMRM